MFRTPRRFFLTLGLLTALCVSATGCSDFWHNMQPHRLHRLNRHAPTQTDEFNAYN